MKLLYAIAVFFLCALTNVHAQKSIINGYVVQLNGDTSKGYIDYKNWDKNPLNITFYKEKNGNKQILDTLSIKAFGVNNGKYVDDYVAQSVEIESSIQNLNLLGDDPNPIFKRKTIFLQKIVSGLVTLLKYTETERIHYFVNKNNVYEELIYKKFFTKSLLIDHNISYKKQLAKLFDDCTSIANGEIDRINYREQDIAKLVLRYNNCISPNSASKVTNTKKNPVIFAAIVGGSYSKLNFDYLSYVNFKPSTDVTLGVSMLVTLPRTSEKLGIYFDALYKRFKFSNDYRNTVSSNQYTINHFNFESNYIKVNSLFRYTFSQSKMKPFINVGISNAFALSEIDKSTITTVFYDSTEDKSQKVLGVPRKYEQGLVAGIGATFNKLGFELRGETTNGFSPIKTDNTAINTAYLLLNYRF